MRSIIAACFIVFALPTAAQPINESVKLLADDGGFFDQFGYSVAVNDATAIIGAFRDDAIGNPDIGSAYVFDTTTGTQIAKLLADDREREDEFGTSVGISGTTAIVGAPGDDDNGRESGSAYLFDLTTGSVIAKLLPAAGSPDDLFGISVAIDGATAIVGAPRDDENGIDAGAAYLFDTRTGFRIAKILPNDGTFVDRFGFSVAISGNTAIVGALGDDDNGGNSGSAYLFDIITGDQIAKLLPQDGDSGDEFGWSVAISGTTALVGARLDEENAGGAGSAYIFDTATGNQIAKLRPQDGESGDQFGISVAVSGATAIIGAFRDDDNGGDAGSAYLFDTTTGNQIAKLLPSDGETADLFGFSVAISGETALVGAYEDDDNSSGSGSAYLFDIKTNSPCLADINNDGNLTGADFNAFLAAFVVTDAAADQNNDDNLTGADFNAFLTNFSAGCD